MATIRIHVDVDRPVEKVFAYVADIRNDVHWWRGVISAERLTGDGGPGTEYAQDTRLFGVRFPARMVVLEVEAPRRFLYRTTDSLTPFTAEYTFTPLAAGRTRFTMTAELAAKGPFRWFGPVFLPLLRLLARRYFGSLRTAVPA